MLVLGLDPGSLHTGYGLLEKQGSAMKLIEAGRFSPPKSLELPQRLARLASSVRELLERTRPEVVVVRRRSSA
jgi:crossover junction endodeoxyribonuclease RuvC